MDLSTFMFSPIYIIGYWIGLTITELIQLFFGVTMPSIIIDNIGLLAIVTILLFLAEIAKKIAWGIVVICWALIIIRIGMLTMGKTQIIIS